MILNGTITIDTSGEDYHKMTIAGTQVWCNDENFAFQMGRLIGTIETFEKYTFLKGRISREFRIIIDDDVSIDTPYHIECVSLIKEILINILSYVNIQQIAKTIQNDTTKQNRTEQQK